MSATAEFDLQPTLTGQSVMLRPLVRADLEPLYAVAADRRIWELHPEPSRYRRTVFEDFFAGALASGGALVVVELASGKVIGSSRYYEWDAERKEIAIGYTFLARSHWGGRTNAEMKHLMLAHAFRRAQRVWFHVGKDNLRSRRAMEKIGGRFSHEARRTGGGVLQDYVYFAIDAHDWTRIRPATPMEAGLLSALALRAKAHWGYSPAQLARWGADLTVTSESIERGFTQVAEEGGVLAGFYQLDMNAAPPELGHLWVEPARMGRGIGRALVKHALGRLASMGIGELGIDSDPNAADFYKRLGAREVGVTPAPIAGQPGRVRFLLRLATGGASRPARVQRDTGPRGRHRP